jgi:hypothetical protein
MDPTMFRARLPLAFTLLTTLGAGCTDDPAPTQPEAAPTARIAAEPAPAPVYTGSSFRAVWDQVASDPYARLPEDKVTVDSFYDVMTSHILAASKRTLTDRSDLLPWFQKLIHPNGICLAGTWNITADTPYTGYFRKGSRGLVVLRASTGMSEIHRDQYRTFGMAAKLFPTLDPDAVVETANVTLTEDLGGRKRDHFLDAESTNDILQIAPTGAAHLGTLVALAHAFTTAEKTPSIPQTLFRQVYSIGEAGEADPTAARSPVWLRIRGASDVPRVLADDFRDELRLARYPQGLRFEIAAADEGTRLTKKVWKVIGTIDITAEAVSESCDHRLHFAHLPFRK